MLREEVSGFLLKSKLIFSDLNHCMTGAKEYGEKRRTSITGESLESAVNFS